ncbi:hypothetical protein KTE64_27665 [Burkholderia multivorans]|uniref:hypothetical protein n=1 Tax=Burkholderia multivorans TaxID=87883 RepID=UPI001C224155|nr:hypothetical protein [Burkholderia multivorans]MBU9516176.1 hypothetical protein [Burkholderia multivorans]
MMDGQATTTALADTLTTLGSFGLLDLSRQQRNLLLLRPVFQLERYKMMLGDESSSDRSLFQGVDTHYLALSALDQMMECVFRRT